MRTKALIIGSLIACIGGVAAASTTKVPESVTVEIRDSDRDRAQTIRAILAVCTYLEETYPKTHKRIDCLDLFQKWVPKSSG